MDGTGDRSASIGIDQLLEALGTLDGTDVVLTVSADRHPARELLSLRGRLSSGPSIRVEGGILAIARVGVAQISLVERWIAGIWHDPKRPWLAIEFAGDVLVELEPPAEPD